MLAALSIRDIVLIDRLDLDFEPGLAVLSGETGAGKSIVLDSLALALGARGDAGLVRQGAGQGSVTASFTGGERADVRALLDEHGIAVSDELVLRRVQHEDGRTRAFINDEPVGARLLRRIGQTLVEIHGQHDERALLEPAAHLELVDAYGAHRGLLGDVAERHDALRASEDALGAQEAALAKASADADYLRHAADELTRLGPEPGEEERLAEERQLMMEGERMAEDLAEAHGALGGENGAQNLIARALRALERADARAPGSLAAVLDAGARSDSEINETVAALEAVMARLDADPSRLEAVEERLFALRAAARKHNVAVDTLPALRDELMARLEAIDGGEERLEELRRAHAEAADAYRAAAEALSTARRAAAQRLDAAVAGELSPLKLEAARFETALEQLEPERGGRNGLDRAEFLISTNPGVPPGPLRKVASGGELSRVMLALKVALAGRGGAPTLIFDEIDSGVGGAVADAIGERLRRLGNDVQVLVVTHSPQVAARGHEHFLIEKEAESADTAADRPPRTKVLVIDGDARREEIARMLAGAQVTDEARAAAARLIGAK